MTTIDPTLASTLATPPTKPSNDGFGQDAFLKLLVAQLKYQDPLNPAEGAEFMAQTAQFTMVEKLTELAAQNTELLSSQRTMAGSSLIGRTITYPGPDGIDATGVVAGMRVGPDGPVLRVGLHDVPLGAVKEVTATT
ncbi:MAG: flagellar hook capping FlgD N-terminal domain-containing protein [Acidimicrobiales bacterium]